MAKTNRYMNWQNASFTPTGQSAIPLKGVTSCKPNMGGDVERFKGDGALFWQALATPTQERSISVDLADVAAAIGIPRGTQGSFSATLADFDNGLAAGGGAITVTLSPCKVTDNTATGDHAKAAGATITFEGYAPDGVTDPLSVTPL